MARSRRREASAQQTGAKSPLRQRDPRVVQMFNLREIEVPLLGSASSISYQTSRLRRKAGRKAWATRVARYGPSGRRATIAPQRRTQPHVVIPASNNTQPLVYDEVIHQSDHELSDATSGIFGGEMDNSLVQSENEDDLDRRDVGIANNDASPQEPQENQRLVPQEVVIFQPPEDPVLNGDGEASEEMLRLLDERRASLLGPQDITRTRLASPVDIAEEPTFPIFEDEDDADAESGYLSSGSHKENCRPTWYGTGRTPRASGPRWVSPPAELHDNAMQPAQAQSRAQVHLGGGVVEPFVRFFE